MSHEQLDHPFEEVVASADDVIARGGKVFFKFTCQWCGARQTFDVPNTLYETGRCEECGAVTNLREQGCNYLAVFDGQI